VIERMETRIGGTAMTSLLGHGGTNGTSPLLCALERGHAELQDERIRARDAALSPEVRQREAWIWFCRSLDIWHRHEAESLHGSDASLPRSIPHLLGHCFGAIATPCGKLALLLRLRRPTGYGFHLRWTLRKCRVSALGVAPTRIASPGVTRADREFKSGDSKCF
jgi:hypothetical protein